MRALGCLPFLNVKPLSYSLERGGLPEGWRLRYAPPSHLADMLRSGKICGAPVSSFACLENPDLRIVPDICIASRGPVRSVLMFSRKPVSDIRSVAIDSGSLSGAAMLRIILAEQYHVSPEFAAAEPDLMLMLAAHDAALLLGNRAMEAAAVTDGGLCVTDLGAEWFQLTGLPAVFAVWAVTPSAPLSELIPILIDSKRQGMRNLQDIARAESATTGLSYEGCLDYLRNIMVYDLGPPEMEGLRAFAAKSLEHGLLDQPADLRFAHVETEIGGRTR